MRGTRRRDRNCRTHAHHRMEANQALPAFAGVRRSGPRPPRQRRTLARAHPRGTVTVSARPEDRPVPSLARASARNARTRTVGRTDGTITDGGTVRQAMSDRERETIRKAGADDARRSRAEHGFPEHIEDPATVAVLAAILRDARAPPRRNTSTERRPAA